jgi:hypothetical protein
MLQVWWDFVHERIVGAPAKLGLVDREYVEVVAMLEWILISGLLQMGRERGVFVPDGRGGILRLDC